MLGRLGLAPHASHEGLYLCGAVVFHGVRCGAMPGLAGLALARENNRDVRRTEASVAGSPAAWSQWAEQVLGGQPNLKIDSLLKLHPLLPDRDLRVWHYGPHAMTLNDLVACIVDNNELRVHLGEVSYEDDDDMSEGHFDFGFEVSDELVIMHRFLPPDVGWTKIDHFPWLRCFAPIDYKARLEAELTRHWGGFENREKDDAVVGEVDGIEICRSDTVYRRTLPA